jgi:hypothetical protein
MVRIDWVYHRHEDAVTLLNGDVIDVTIKVIDVTIKVIDVTIKVIDVTIKVIIQGRTCVLHLLISLIHIHMRGFILVFFYIVGNAPD